MKSIIIILNQQRQPMSKEHFCVLHPAKTLSLYCDSCKDAVCNICTQLGPHADVRHIIMPIQQAVQVRTKFYFLYRDREINPLRQRVSLYLSRLDKQQQMYANDRRVIEKDINIQFQGIISRIKAIVSQEIVKRQTDIKSNQQIINKIDDLAYSFEAIIQFPQRFLMCYKQFNSQLKQLQSLSTFTTENMDKNIKQQFYESSLSVQAKPKPIEIQLPQEFALALAKISQLPLYAQKNNFMNGLILRSVNYYNDQIKKAGNQIIANQKRILKIYNTQNAELLQLQSAIICAYCLTSFSVSETNQVCNGNKSFKSEPTYKEVVIPADIKGAKIHYWVPAKKSERPVPNLKSHSLIRNLQKKQYYNSLMDIRQVECKLRAYDIEKYQQQAYLLQFKQDDPFSTGKVTPLAFLFIMTNKFQVPEVQVQVLSELCEDKESKMIDYRLMEDVIKNPLKPYTKFIEDQDQIEKAKPVGPASFKFRY